MLDTINLERRGIPATVLGQDNLLSSSGKGMAAAQGYPSLQFAAYPYEHSKRGGAATEAELKARAQLLAPQVERILTNKI